MFISSMRATFVSVFAVGTTHAIQVKLKDIADYEQGCKLGQGGFGKVYKCQLKDNTSDSKMYALKKFENVKNVRIDKFTVTNLSKMEKIKKEVEKRQKMQHDMFYMETSIMDKLDHKHIVKLKEHKYQETADFSYMVLELCNGGDLSDYHFEALLRNFDENVLKKYLKDVFNFTVEEANLCNQKCLVSTIMAKRDDTNFLGDIMSRVYHQISIIFKRQNKIC